MVFNTTSIDVTDNAASLVVTYTVTDASGVNDPSSRCQLVYSGNRYIYSDAVPQRISGDNKEGSYQCNFTITTSAVPGTIISIHQMLLISGGMLLEEALFQL